MNMKISFFHRIAAPALGLVLALSAAAPALTAFAEDADPPEAVVLRSNTPFYLKNGEKVFYEEGSGYYPETVGGEIMVPVDMAAKMLDFSYTYSTSREEAEITKDDTTLSIRAGMVCM